MTGVQTAVRDAAPAVRETSDRASGPRRLGFDALRASLAQGWRGPLAKPGQDVPPALIHPPAGLVPIRATSDDRRLALVRPPRAGFAPVGPVAAIGAMEFARRLERGERPRWRGVTPPVAAHAMSGLQGRAFGARWPA